MNANHHRGSAWTWRLLWPLLLLGACSEPPQPTSTPPIFLITIDTLRADRLGLYGYERETSPFLDQLGREALVFDNAIATCPATAPSVASILTGVHRARHGVIRNGSILLDDVTTMAETLQHHGYRTLGIVANPCLIDGGPTGFEQGFDEFFMPKDMVKKGPTRFAGEVIPEEVDALLKHHDPKRPLFVWIHFMDPHGPYHPPDSVRALFPAEDYVTEGPTNVPVSENNYGLGVIPQYQSHGYPDSASVADYLAAYDGEIRTTDETLRSLVGVIQDHGYWDSSLCFITSDHGESLGEHNYYFQHGWFVYEDSLRVPLLVRLPGGLQSRRIRETVSLIDIVPTLADYLDIDWDGELEGESLLELLDHSPRDRQTFAQTYYGNRVTSLRVGQQKYIFTPAPPKGRDRRWEDGWKASWPSESHEEFYDLSADPGEMTNRADKALGSRSREELEHARDLVADWLDEQNDLAEGRSRRFRKDIGLDQVLEALGYAK